MSERLIAVIGKFDALHRGHRALVAAAAELGTPTVLSFSGMAEELGWEPRPPITAPSQRALVLADWSRSLGVPVAACSLPFAELRPLAPQAFIDHLQREHGFGGIVCGEDFRFGRGRSGGVDELRAAAAERELVVRVVPPVVHNGAAISSSRVRAAIEAGAMDEVRALLGRPHRVVGTVVRGAGRGAGIGFPTANLQAIENLLPPDGVYAARADLDAQALMAAVNIGHAPSVAEGRERLLEAHLLDWQGDCYGRTLVLDLLERIRGEQRFDGPEALRAQIARDVTAVRRRLAGAAQSS